MRNDTLMQNDYFEVPNKHQSEPDFVKDFSDHGQIHHIHFSQFEWTKDIMLLAFDNKVLFAQLSFQDRIVVDKLFEFTHASHCTALSISPNTSLAVLPNQIVFASGAADYKIRVFESDANEKNTCRDQNQNPKNGSQDISILAPCILETDREETRYFKVFVEKEEIYEDTIFIESFLVLSGHTGYINDVTFDTENLYLASASDDNTVKLWFTDGFKLKATFNVTSPAMVVSWHRSDSGKLLVAEKIGLIKFYNVETETPILSLDFAKSLSSAHWAPSDSQLLATLQLGEVLLWDLTNPCLPQQSAILFPENGGNVKFSPQGELLAAVNSLDGSLKVVHTMTQSLKLSASVSLPTNVQWHFYYPIVCVGDDSKLCFWKVNK